jgi:hypothetical protein
LPEPAIAVSPLVDSVVDRLIGERQEIIADFRVIRACDRPTQHGRNAPEPRLRKTIGFSMLREWPVLRRFRGACG